MLQKPSNRKITECRWSLTVSSQNEKLCSVTWNSRDSKCFLNVNCLPCLQGASASLSPLSLLWATWSRRVCYVHLSRARATGQPPSLHYREARLCQLGTDFRHPFLPAGLEPPAAPCQLDAGGNGHSSSPGAPEDVTLNDYIKGYRILKMTTVKKIRSRERRVLILMNMKNISNSLMNS